MQESEKESRRLRRSLYITSDVKKGDLVSHENVRAIRPGGGCEPKLIDVMMGRVFGQDFNKGTPMSLECIE
jgi:N-acetylneuraminate synthase